MEDLEKNINLEQVFSNLFEKGGSGEEELLRIASTYSRQITPQQIKAILLLNYANSFLKTDILKDFCDKWLELQQFNNSATFVMRALESISLKKFIGDQTFKINVDK